MRSFFSKYGRRVSILGTTSLIPICALSSANTMAMDVNQAHPPHYPFVYKNWLNSFDTAGLRRGYQVYKEICSSCHPMSSRCYRHFVGVFMTEKQAKEEAASALIEDGPNEDGDLILRPGVLTDVLPPPYKNDMAARAANNGALPPDLSLIVGARHGEGNYVFSLLTGYGHEVPPGQVLERGQHFNPFFNGGAISMAPPLMDGAVEYPDGTPATVTQMSADVVEYLTWSHLQHLQRQRIRAMMVTCWAWFAALFFVWMKKLEWAHWASQRVTYKMKPM